MTLGNVADISRPDDPELRRALGQFQVFAFSFAFVSVAVGILGDATFHRDVLDTEPGDVGAGAAVRVNTRTAVAEGVSEGALLIQEAR